MDEVPRKSGRDASGTTRGWSPFGVTQSVSTRPPPPLPPPPLQVERERGITVKAQTATMLYTPTPQEAAVLDAGTPGSWGTSRTTTNATSLPPPYLLNLIDTPHFLIGLQLVLISYTALLRAVLVPVFLRIDLLVYYSFFSSK